MKKTDRNALIAFPILFLIGVLVALAGSQGGETLVGIPLFAGIVGLAFLVQWLVFIPSFLRQTEKFFDLTGSLTYITLTVIAVLLTPGVDARAMLVLILLAHDNVEGVLLVSAKHEHALAGPDVQGEGARFPWKGRAWLVGETTDEVPLGLIDRTMADPKDWLAVELPFWTTP